jgi:putative nucleotidyltransferase with HDIG domain
MKSKKEEGKFLILEVLELPTLSTILNKVLKVAGNDRSSAADMAEVISKDQALTANILKIANSAYFGLSQEVTTVLQAIVVLGFDAVRSIALSASVIDAFRGAGSRHFDRTRFWTHSLACAYLCKKIATMTHRVDLETAFVSGLLHDLGKIVLDIHFPDSYARAMSRAAEGKSVVDAEVEVLGFSHAEVVMWMAQRWKFPKPIIFSIANHHGHMANDERYDPLAAIVRVANRLCLQEGICLPDQTPSPFDESELKEIKLDEGELARLRELLATRKESFVSLFSDWEDAPRRA